MVARVGKEAPNFEAAGFVRDFGFKPVKLSDYEGKVTSPSSDPPSWWRSPPPTTNCSRWGVEVLATSTDSRFVHKIWREQELSKMLEGGVPFPMLSDAGGKIGTVYGIYDEAAGADIRGRFIIDPDFVIRAMEVPTPEVGCNPDELVRQIRAFQHVPETGEVTPSS